MNRLVAEEFCAVDKSATFNHKVFLRLENVSRVFQMGERAIHALDKVSMDFLHGEIVVVVGPSGSGKTTLLNVIGGLDRPTAGNVWFHGEDLSQASKRKLTEYRRRSAGFVFQLYNLIPDLTARENVMMAAELCPLPMDVENSLKLVGLEDRMHHFPAQLSGGEQQRVAIARALVKQPEALLCDEPTGALDFSTGKKVLTLLVELNKSLGKTVVIVTHNSAISQIAHRVVRMRSGAVVELQTNPDPLSPSEISW